MNKVLQNITTTMAAGQRWLGTVAKNRDLFASTTFAVLPANVAMVIISINAPSVANFDKLWLQVNLNGKPLALYKVVAGQWIAITNIVSYGTSYPSTDPATNALVIAGCLYWNTDTNQLFVYDGTDWIASGVIRFNTVAPTSPVKGQLWWGANGLSIYDTTSSNWIPVTIRAPIKVVTDNYTVDANVDCIIAVSKLASVGVVIRLPACESAGAGREITIYDRDGTALIAPNAITIAAAVGETIATASTDPANTKLITVKYGSVTLRTEGTRWNVTSNNT